MKAKDTVIPVPRLCHSKSVYCSCGEEIGIESEVEYERELQAEVSFKEGIKEVVDWIKYYLEVPEIKGAVADKIIRPQLQAKLKEWGLK